MLKSPLCALSILVLGTTSALPAADAPSLVIDDFKDVSGWKNFYKGEPAFSAETKIKHDGQPGLHLQLTPQARAEKDLQVKELSTADGVSFWMYSSKADDAVLGLAFTTQSTTPGWNYFFTKITVDWQGWKQFVLKKSDFQAVRSPDWGTVKQVMLSIRDWNWGKPAPEDFVVISDLELVPAKP
ncbi:MAG: hypothetical protein INR62_07325 [Rhodospirillales bacterium]|nr:hypothetical protein [Acetobacter sp.]